MRNIQGTYDEHLKRATREIESALRLVSGSSLSIQDRKKVLRKLDPVLMLIKQSSRVKLVNEEQEQDVKKTRGNKDGNKRGRNAN